MAGAGVLRAYTAVSTCALDTSQADHTLRNFSQGTASQQVGRPRFATMSDHEGLPLTADAAAVEGRQRKWPLQGRLALVVALVVLIAAAINITYLRSVAAPESCNKGHSSNSLAMPHRCNFSTLSASAAAWMPTCYPLDDSASAVLDPTVLQLLQERQQQSQLVDDWLQLGSSSRSALRCTSFSIPKVIHQTWLGKAPQPKRWIDTFRVNYVAKCPGWTYKLWTDDNLSKLRHIDRAFYDKEGTFYGKSDILRLAAIYEHGGVYIDADTQWVNDKCLDDILLLASDTGFFAATEPGKPFAANGVYGAVRHHPVTRLYQQTQVILSTGGRGGEPWQRLGPLGISAAMGAADNHVSSQHCTADSGSQGKLKLQPSYFEEDLPASTSHLMTVLSSRYFYPISWHNHNIGKDQLTNLTYVSEMVSTKYPEAAMYQLGFSTHGYTPDK